MGKRIFLYTEEEKKRKDNILAYTERLLKEAGAAQINKGITPEQAKAFIDLLREEKTPTEIKNDAELLNRKYFYMSYTPSYEDTGKTIGTYEILNDEFLLDGSSSVYRAFIKWDCVYSDTVGLGILKSFEIERDSEAYKLLKVSEFEAEALTKEQISEIRRLLGLTDYSFTYSIDRPPLFYLACSLLSACVQEIEEDPERKTYKTRAKAEEKVKISRIESGKMPVITEKSYQHGLSFYPEGKAYLAPPLTDTSDLKMESGKIFFAGDREATEAEVKSLTDPNKIINVDTSLLNPFYKIALDEFQENNDLKEIVEEGKSLRMQDVYNIYLPDYNDRFGGSSRMHEEDIEGFIKKGKPV